VLGAEAEDVEKILIEGGEAQQRAGA